MEQYDSRVDAYIEKSAAFAKPILEYIRQVVHDVSPGIGETIKWGMPFFDYKGQLCHMAAFKQHCAMGFWRAPLINDPQGLLNGGAEAAMGSLGRLTGIADLPPKEILMDYIQQAMRLNDEGIKKPVKKPTAAERAELTVPDYLHEALSANPKALEVFYNFSYTGKKEYIEWLTEAKTEATRQKRLDTAIEWMSEGKSRNWKYK